MVTFGIDAEHEEFQTKQALRLCESGALEGVKCTSVIFWPIQDAVYDAVVEAEDATSHRS